MKRLELQFLMNWKAKKDRKPLIIRGARQVGKTWLMKTFGQAEFQAVAYVNFEANKVLQNLFSSDFDVERILMAIRIETGLAAIDPANTLLIFDEIQEAAGALTSLKYFYENAPQYHIIAAGSLLGVALSKHQSFPVGKVDFLDLHPLTFAEFLEAIGDGQLLDLIAKHDWALVTSFAARFVERLKQYYFVGGMPEAVLSFSTDRDFQTVREIQRRILIAYEQDFSKHAPNAIVPRIRMLWNSIPSQLAKANKKFIYGLIRQGARAKDYELALSWLIDCGLVLQVKNVSKPVIPLKAYEEQAAFKLYLVDVGLLSALSGLDAVSLLDEHSALVEFKGALTEQFVLQQLAVKRDLGIFYWAAENARAEVDFVLQIGSNIVPLEVKAAENLKAKSLRVFFDKFHPAKAVRTSLSPYRQQDWMVNLPLYAIQEITNLF